MWGVSATRAGPTTRAAQAGPPTRAGHCPTRSSRILGAERPPPGASWRPAPSALAQRPTWKARSGTARSKPGPSGPSTLPAPHDLSTAHQSPLGKAGPSPASGWPRAWISKYQENGGRRPASPGAPCSCHPTQGLCALAPRGCPAPSTFSTSGQEAGPKCRSELIWFCPPRRTFAHFLQHPEPTVNSRSRCTRALGLACTETEMEVTRRGTEKNLPSRRKLMVTRLGTVATERK